MATTVSRLLGRPVWYELMTTDTGDVLQERGRLDVRAIRRVTDALHRIQAQR